MTGNVNESSISGQSTGTTDVTNNNQPDFQGTSQPFSDISLFATPTGAVPIPIGTTQAGSDGSWNLVSTIPLPDKYYAITATGVDQFGKITTPPRSASCPRCSSTPRPGDHRGGLRSARCDLGGQLPGHRQRMDLEGVETVRSITAKPLAKNVHVLPYILPTSITVQPGPTLGSFVEATIVFHHGRELRGGLYTILINSGSGNSGIEDNAENAMSGTFYGHFPTGNGRPGGNFQALLATFHNKVEPFVPISAGHVSPATPTIRRPVAAMRSRRPRRWFAPPRRSSTWRSRQGQLKQSVPKATHAVDKALEHLDHESVVKARRR